MQQKVTEMYCDKDMSLGEISESLGISRQGVRDSLLKAEKYLDNYEQILKLGGILNQLTAIAESDESDAGAIKAKLSEIINNIKE